jgi:hypothetical protein
MIYNNEPILVLWDALKSLNTDIPIYKETMDEDADSTPESYILLRSDISNAPALYGDGKTQIRAADCDIILVTKGIATNTTDLHNINKDKVRDALLEAEIPFEAYNLGYDDSIKSSQYTWSVSISYICRKED